MNNELIFNNYLMLLKSTVEVYIHGTLESSNEDVREILRTGLDDILTSQANTYDIMTERNWYSINNVKITDIKKLIDKLNKK